MKGMIWLLAALLLALPALSASAEGKAERTFEEVVKG